MDPLLQVHPGLDQDSVIKVCSDRADRALRSALQQRLAPALQQALTPQTFPAVFTNALEAALLVVQPGGLAAPLRLEFRHDCLAQGCASAGCALCERSVERRCARSLGAKCLADTPVRARCGAVLRVEVMDPATGAPFKGRLHDMRLELTVLDAKAWDEACAAASAAPGGAPAGALDAAVASSQLLMNGKEPGKGLGPLLVAGGEQNDDEGRLVLPSFGGRVELPDLQFTSSGEAVVHDNSKKPRWRVLARAMHTSGAPPPIEPAVSDEFVVATRRTKSAIKPAILTLNDPVSKIVNVGDKTIERLADLRAAAMQKGMDVFFPPGCCASVHVVREFQALMGRMEANEHFKLKVLSLLCMDKDGSRWRDACEHAKGAVEPDSRMRAWLTPSMDRGLLFPCQVGKIDLNSPVALLESGAGGDGAPSLIVVPSDLQASWQRRSVGELVAEARACWKAEGHPGWTLTHIESDLFESMPQQVCSVSFAALAAAAGAAGGAAAAAAAAAAAMPSAGTGGAEVAVVL